MRQVSLKKCCLIQSYKRELKKMRKQKNDFYSSTIEEFFAGKDSMMEMAKIISYDRERLVAKVYTLTSKQYKNDVPVFFPSMHLNTGIISPPAVNSTSFLFWGADRQPYLLPIQFNVPTISVKNGVNTLNASPSFIDQLLSLKNIQGGEHLFRSLGGGYVFLKNTGDVELGTSRLHRMSLIEKDGALDILNERIKAEVGNSRIYLGPLSMDSNKDMRSHFNFQFDETSNKSDQLVPLSDEEILQKLLDDHIDGVQLEETPKIFNYQFGHVLDEHGEIERDEKDGSELFSKQQLKKENASRTEQVSKEGRKVIVVKNNENEIEISYSANEVMIKKEMMVEGVAKTTHIEINEQGEIVCGKDGKTYDLMPVLKWFYEERLQE
jgi:hypothetical protein